MKRKKGDGHLVNYDDLKSRDLTEMICLGGIPSGKLT